MGGLFDKINMKCIINQPCGLGDILFCQKIANILDYNIIKPLSKYNHIIHQNVSKMQSVFSQIVKYIFQIFFLF